MVESISRLVGIFIEAKQSTHPFNRNLFENVMIFYNLYFLQHLHTFDNFLLNFNYAVKKGCDSEP